MSRRTERLAPQILGEIARVLREEISDPRIGFVTLTRVDVAPDLSHAAVFWSSVEAPAREEEIQRGLASAAPYVRRSLARALQLRRTPELRFRHDPSLELADRTRKILGEIDDTQRS
jgi:ribosome-binding factor A